MRTRLNPPNVRIVHAIPFGKGGFRLIAGTDSGNVNVGKPAVPMIQPVIVPSLFSRIGVIFGLGANAQMGRVDARRVVAGMHDDHAFWDRANVKFIRVPMSANRFFSRHKQNSVSVSIAVALPFPAAFSFLKTILKHISRAKNRVFMQSVIFGNTRVTTAAQFSAYRFSGPTLNANNLGFGFVSHRLPPVTCSL